MNNFKVAHRTLQCCVPYVYVYVCRAYRVDTPTTYRPFCFHFVLFPGPDVFFLPLRGVNTSHMRAAAALLDSFSAVVPIDYHSGAGAAAMRRELGFVGAPQKKNAHGLVRSRLAPAATMVGGGEPRTWRPSRSTESNA